METLRTAFDRILPKRFPALCLVCGVDSGPIRNFLILFIGSLVLTSVSVLVWGLVTGRFRDENGAAKIPLAAEEAEERSPR